MNENKSTCPGVMLYFNDYKKLRTLLTPEQRLAIIDAYVDFAELGKKPNFDDNITAIVWNFGNYEFLANRDARRYEKRMAASRKGSEAGWNNPTAYPSVNIDALKEFEHNL